LDFYWNLLRFLDSLPVMRQKFCQIKAVIAVIFGYPCQHIGQPLPGIYIAGSTAYGLLEEVKFQCREVNESVQRDHMEEEENTDPITLNLKNTTKLDIN
jgi:hypothetical protein